MDRYFSPQAGLYRQAEPEGIERKVMLPSPKGPDMLWSNDYLFKKDGKWYEHHKGEWRSWGGHNDGGASTWEREDLDDRKVEDLIKEGKAVRL